MKTAEHKSLLSKIVASDIMTEGVEVVNQKTTIGQVAHLMLRNRISGYPVVDDKKRVVGIVTLNDLFVLIDKMAWDSSRRPDKKHLDLQEKLGQYKDRPVSDIMVCNVISLSPETPLLDIIDAVVKWRIHTFPVMKNNKLLGIIGRHDILNATFVYS